MKKLEIRPSRANRPRNAFDLSQRHMFTAPVGALLPVLSLDLIPHDHVEINAQDFMRTLPMNSSAFMSLRGVYEFFFVPYSQLWHPFDQFIAGTNDYRSNYFNVSSTPLAVPSCTRESLFKEALKFSEIGHSSPYDIFGFPRSENCLRLLDLLGYGYPVRAKSNKGYLSNIFNGSVTPFRAAAYQKIYSDYYRNNIYEPYDVNSFNFDSSTSTFPADKFVNMLKLRYRNHGLDYLTNLRPSPLFSSPQIQGLQQALAVSSPTGKLGVVTSDKTSVALTAGPVGPITTSSIRGAFALDKLLSISMRAGRTYAEQVEAHFGVKVSEGRDGQVYYLGGFDSNFETGDITQTAGAPESGSSAGGYLGRVVGKSIGTGKGSVSFDAKEHGVLMCIYSALPAMQYDSSRVDPFVHKTSRGDFFIPEFENLGMQPLMDFNVTDHSNDEPSATTDELKFKGGNPLGWQLRYSEYKTAIDVNHGQFGYSGPLSFWTISRNRAFSDNFSGGSLTISDLKVSPKCVDSVFAVNYNGKQVTDQLFGGCYFGITKVSDMSVDGLPRV